MDEQINNSPTVIRLLAEAEQHKGMMEKIRDAFNNSELHLKYQESDQKLKKVEAQLAAERKRLRPRILRELQEKIHGKTPDSISMLRARIASLKGIENLYRSEVERLRKTVESLTQKHHGGKIDAFRDDMRHIENLTQLVINEEQALKVELEVPPECKVLEEAQGLHAETKSRRAMIVASSAAAAFAATLLAIAFWVCYLRNRVRFLGLNW